MRDEEFDPYRPSLDGQPLEEPAVIANFLEDVEQFLENVFDNPPDALRGEWLEEQRQAWQDLRRPGAEAVRDRVEARHITFTELQDHGLTGQALRAKMLSWRDSSRAFLARRGTRRLAKALRTGGVVLDSAAEVFGFGGAHKEIIKGLQYLTELAIEEGA